MLSHVMASSTAHNTLLFISYFFLGFTLQHCSARDTITPETPINSTSGETLISAGKIFELGFFTRTRPDSSTNNTYVGIWYYNLSPPKMIVWVANRDNPLTNFGILKVEDGNLVLSGENGCFINISTGVSVSTNSHTKGKLLDSGNLVLTRPGKLLWQSFDHPTDTFLPGMVMTQSLRLTSWRSPDDPGTGNFTFRQDDNQTTVIWKRDKKYWVSREWGESASYSYMNTKVECLVLNFNTINTTTTATTGAHYISYNTIRTNSCVFDYTYLRLVMDSSGELQFWNISGDSRHKQWFAPEDRLCSLYNFCGDFGICNRQSNSPCKCLMPTFEPCSPDNWKSGDFSDGCKRKSVSAFSEKDEFYYLPTVRVAPPAVNLKLDNETECLSQCLMDSTCQAYSYTEDTQQKRVTEEPYKGRTCWFWIYDLQNLVENATQEGRDLYVRIPSQDPDFGLARIVAGKEVEANTNKVVGTYGYMSPEYALDGLFSIKSDVYSFGVIILEIISGKRNTRFYQSQQAQNLPSYAWTLWREEKPLDLMDRSLLSSCNEGEVLKCITIGLLCVQEDPNDPKLHLSQTLKSQLFL
ncbi:Non-specific serine/threonine protein kinase [Bertholletia excelsa]